MIQRVITHEFRAEAVCLALTSVPSGPVTDLCRSLFSLMRLFFQRPGDFSNSGQNVFCADYRSR